MDKMRDRDIKAPSITLIISQGWGQSWGHPGTTDLGRRYHTLLLLGHRDHVVDSFHRSCFFRSICRQTCWHWLDWCILLSQTRACSCWIACSRHHTIIPLFLLVFFCFPSISSIWKRERRGLNVNFTPKCIHIHTYSYNSYIPLHRFRHWVS